MGRKQKAAREHRIDLMTYFKDYIDGVKEISEVNAAFNGQDMSQNTRQHPSMSCGMGMRR